jgi:hypothetical protein
MKINGRQSPMIDFGDGSIQVPDSLLASMISRNQNVELLAIGISFFPRLRLSLSVNVGSFWRMSRLQHTRVPRTGLWACRSAISLHLGNAGPPFLISPSPAQVFTHAYATPTNQGQPWTVTFKASRHSVPNY